MTLAQPLPPDVHRREVSTPSVSLSCLFRDSDGIREGTSRQTILFVHGAQLQATTWLPILRCLPADVPVLAPDLRSHGLSERGEALGINEWADDLESVLNSFEAGPVHVVGHSVGAAIAIELAARRPQQILSIVTLGGAFLPAPITDADTAEALRVDGAMPTLRRMVVEDILAPTATDAVREEALAQLSENDLETAAAVLIASNHTDVRPRLDAIRCPLLLVSGDQDMICPVDEARWLADETNSNLLLIPRVGHLPQHEDPAAAAAHIWAGVTAVPLEGTNS